MVLPTYFLGRLFLPLWGAITAAALVAFSPHLISMTAYILNEAFYSSVFIAGIFFFYSALKQKKVPLFVVSGIFLGYACFTKEQTFFIPFIFAVIILFSHGFAIKKILGIRHLWMVAVFLAVFAMFPFGWMLRNKVRIPDAQGLNSSGNKLFQNVAAGTYPRFIHKDPKHQFYMYRDDPIFWDYVQSFSTFKRVFAERFRENPWKYIRWYLIEKPYYLWRWDMMQGQKDIYVYPVITSMYLNSRTAFISKEIMRLIHPVLLVLYFAGIPVFYFACLRRKSYGHLYNTPIFLFAILIYFNVLYTALCPLCRYSISLRPILYLVAIWTLKTGIEFLPERLRASPIPSEGRKRKKKQKKRR